MELLQPPDDGVVITVRDDWATTYARQNRVELLEALAYRGFRLAEMSAVLTSLGNVLVESASAEATTGFIGLMGLLSAAALTLQARRERTRIAATQAATRPERGEWPL